MSCTCIDSIQDHLEADGVYIRTVRDLEVGGMRFVSETGGERGTERALLAVAKGDPKRRKRLPTVIARFCPFCGAEYRGQEVDK